LGIVDQFADTHRSDLQEFNRLTPKQLGEKLIGLAYFGEGLGNINVSVLFTGWENPFYTKV
jgi:hypothetical protein